MKNIPQNIKETIQKFTIETQKLLGERVKKWYYMAHMQEEIIIAIQT